VGERAVPPPPSHTRKVVLPNSHSANMLWGEFPKSCRWNSNSTYFLYEK